MVDNDQSRGRAGGLLDQVMVAKLMGTAREAARNAYVPYSSFPVGAAVLTSDGAIIAGANIENASYGLTCCGERVAIFTAVAAGHRTILAVAVSASRAFGTTPCGACRQVMNEFRSQEGDVIVLVESEEGIHQVPLQALLPHAFNLRDLGRAEAGNDEA